MAATFVLVHGAFGSPAALAPIIPYLETLGHHAIAVDLPCENPTAGLEDYARTVTDTLDAIDGRRILVGHSAGGATAVLAATKARVDHLVLVTALVPEPGRSMFDVAGPDMAAALDAISIDHGDGTRSMNADLITSMVPPEQRSSVLEHIQTTTRRQGWQSLSEPWPGAHMPDVPTTYILCTEDNTVPPDLQRQFARSLNVEPVDLASDHDAFTLKPQELARLLNDLA